MWIIIWLLSTFFIFINKIFTYIIRENIKEYLIENRESKNINLARKYLKNKSYSNR